jgi:hypothetical protein
MARALRRQAPGAIYHLMSRGVRKLPIFTSDEDRVIFLRILAEPCASSNGSAGRTA